MAYIPDVHLQASLEFERYLKRLRDKAKNLKLILCDGNESDAHMRACQHLITWARENRHLEALAGKFQHEIYERHKLLVYDVRMAQTEELARWFEQYHQVFIGVYGIALAELKEKHEEFAKIAEKERKRTQDAFKQSA